jgi:hypothetical protein
MRTIILLLLLVLTITGYSQNLTERQKLNRQREEEWKRRSTGTFENTVNTPEKDLTGIPAPPDQIETSGDIQLNKGAFSNATKTSARRSPRGRTAAEPLKKLAKSALIKQYDPSTQVYSDRYMYLYKYESDSSYYQYQVEKDEAGNYTDTVQYEYYKFHPSLTMDTEAEYKSYRKVGERFELTEWYKDLSSYVYEDDGVNHTEWFSKYEFSCEYELDDNDNYYLMYKSEDIYNDHGDEILTLSEEYDAEGNITYGWKGQHEEKILSDGSKEEKYQYLHFADGAYRIEGVWTELFNASGYSTLRYGMEWNNTLSKLDSAGRSGTIYDSQNRETFSYYLGGYNQNGTWQHGNRSYFEYQAAANYVTKEWLDNGVWKKSDKQEIITSPNKREVIVYVWSSNTWQKSIKWSYDYYDNQKLKRMYLYLWNNVNDWYVSEYSHYQYYEYNSAGQQTLFERYYRYDRNNCYKVINEYDGENRLVKVKQYNAHTNNINSIPWENAYETTIAYNNFGQQTLYDFKRWKDGVWLQSSLMTSLSDVDGNILETKNEGFNWDSGIQNWGLHVIYTLSEGDFNTICTKPTITLEGSDTEAVQLTSSVSSGNQWFKDGIAIDGATAASYDVSEPGMYQVQVNSDVCLVFSDEQSIVITDVEESMDVKVKVYPNPVQEELVVDASSMFGSRGFHVSLYESSGRLVSQQNSTQAVSLDIRSLKPGNYFVKVGNGKQSFTKKIIKR